MATPKPKPTVKSGVSPKQTWFTEQQNAKQKAAAAAKKKAAGLAMSQKASSAKKPAGFNPLYGSSDVSKKGMVDAAIRRAKIKGSTRNSK